MMLMCMDYERFVTSWTQEFKCGNIPGVTLYHHNQFIHDDDDDDDDVQLHLMGFGCINLHIIVGSPVQ